MTDPATTTLNPGAMAAVAPRERWSTREREIADETLSTTSIRMRSELEAYQKADDERRAMEAAEAKVRADAKKEAEDTWKEQMAEISLKESEARLVGIKTRNRILTAIATILGAGAAGGGAYLARDRPLEVAPAQVQKTVEASATVTDARIDKAEKKIERLGEMAIDAEVNRSDEGEYTRALIRAAHERQSATLDAVLVPPSVTAAKTKADAIKKKRGTVKVAENPADPFAGIE